MFNGDLDLGKSKNLGFQESARKFMMDCGVNPTQDAVEQLTEAFLPCLRIMCGENLDGSKRETYDPNGKTWQSEGWRGMLWKLRDKSDRLWYHGWRKGFYHPDHAPDMINYLGFYMRCVRENEWGTRGAPGYDQDWDPE